MSISIPHCPRQFSSTVHSIEQLLLDSLLSQTQVYSELGPPQYPHPSTTKSPPQFPSQSWIQSFDWSASHIPHWSTTAWPSHTPLQSKLLLKHVASGSLSKSFNEYKTISSFERVFLVQTFSES